MEMAMVVVVVVVVVVQEVDRGAATPTTYPPFSGVRQPKDMFYHSTTQNQ
jgi:hypothetical protein